MGTITRALLEEGMNGNGGWNRKQLDLIGVSWPPKKGWREWAIGKEISDRDAERFIALKGDAGRARKRKIKLRRVESPSFADVMALCHDACVDPGPMPEWLEREWSDGETELARIYEKIGWNKAMLHVLKWCNEKIFGKTMP